MDELLRRQTVTVSRSVLDAREEYLFSGDYVLPEYCPDVAVVLKCRITPRVQNRRISGEQLQLDGTAAVQVLYLDEERQCVREAEFSQPLSCTLRAEGIGESALVRVSMTPEYVNCRATSPRRLEVRGSFAVLAQADAAVTVELATPQEENGLYVQTAQASLSLPRASAEKIVALSEVLDFDSELPEAEQLLGGECTAAVQECKLLAGKAIVKGQVIVHRLYTDDSAKGTTHALDYTMPFGQILDLEGAQEGMLCTADVSILSDAERCVLNASGQSAALEVNARLLLQVQVYEPSTVPLVLDAYHTGYPVTLERQELSLRTPVGCLRQTATVQKSLDLPADNLQELIDVWVQPSAMPAVCDNGRVQLPGRLLVCMLVRDTDGVIAYYERPEEFSLEYTAQGSEAQAAFAAMGVGYTAASGKLELRVNLAVSVTLFGRVEQRVVSEASLREDQPYPPQKAAVKIYYAQPGERVWDIARDCHTAPAFIREENHLTGNNDTLTAKTVLIVPMA